MPKNALWTDEMDAALLEYLDTYELANRASKRWLDIFKALKKDRSNLFSKVTYPKQIYERWYNHLNDKKKQLTPTERKKLEALLSNPLIMNQYYNEDNSIAWTRFVAEFFPGHAYNTIKNRGNSISRARRRRIRGVSKGDIDNITLPPTPQASFFAAASAAAAAVAALPLPPPLLASTALPYSLPPTPPSYDDSISDGLEDLLFASQTDSMDFLDLDFDNLLQDDPLFETYSELTGQSPPCESTTVDAHPSPITQAAQSPTLPIYPGLEVIDIKKVPNTTKNFLWSGERKAVLQIIAARHADKDGSITGKTQFIFDELNRVAPLLFKDLSTPRQVKLFYNNNLRPGLKKISTDEEYARLHQVLDDGGYSLKYGVPWRYILNRHFKNYFYDCFKEKGSSYLRKKETESQNDRRKATTTRRSSGPRLFNPLSDAGRQNRTNTNSNESNNSPYALV